MSIEMEVGELKGKMESLKEQVAAMDSKLDTLVDTISQSKGGWKVLSILISIAAAAGFLGHRLAKIFEVYNG